MVTPIELLDRSVAYVKGYAGKHPRRFWSGVIVVSLLLIARPSSKTTTNHIDNTGADNSSMAYIQCQDHVKEYLKAPSTAKFSDLSETEIRGGNGKYAIIGWVDSQNSFGAMLRTKYICKATDEGNGQWTFDPLMTNDGE